MKARPRHVEREVAAFFEKLRLEAALPAPKIERIPVLGRTGPDLTFPNAFNLAIDVKSRLAVPKTLWPSSLYLHGNHFLTIELGARWNSNNAMRPGPHEHWSVRNWLDHMAEWTDEHGGFPALVLHRPGMPFERALLVMLESNFTGWRLWIEKQYGPDTYRRIFR